jgi:hypothetical protein
MSHSGGTGVGVRRPHGFDTHTGAPRRCRNLSSGGLALRRCGGIARVDDPAPANRGAHSYSAGVACSWCDSGGTDCRSHDLGEPGCRYPVTRAAAEAHR